MIAKAQAAQTDLLDDYIEAHIHGVISLATDLECVVLDPVHTLKHRMHASRKGNGATIPLVDDDKLLVKVVKEMLESAGYNIPGVPLPSAALELAASQRDIDLLITDVVMPEMNGRELSCQLGDSYKGLKILYTSGYTADIITHHGVLDEGVNFISKPFSKDDLLRKVESVLLENFQ